MRAEDVTGFKIWKYSILLLFLLAFTGVSVAANHYVWCGATGSATGADFTNAYADLPASLVRGDTYYIAGSASCSYGAHTFNDALSGTSVISILHATASANSGVAGWQASFGTTPAEWLTSQAYRGWTVLWIIQQGYYTFDGELGTTGTTEPTSGTFGLYLHKTGDGVVPVYLDGSTNGAVLYNITLNHAEIDGSPMNVGNLVNGANGLMTVQSSGLQSVSGLSLHEVYMHDMETGFLQMHAPANLTVDHSWFSRLMYTASAHGNGVAINPYDGGYSASNLTFSNDTWEDVCGTSVITVMTGTISGLVIYGNTFFQTTNTEIFPGATNPSFCNGDGQIGDLGVGNGSSNSGGGLTTSATIYNNTFYSGSTSGGSGVFFTNTNSTNIVQTNNLFVNNQNLYLTMSCNGCSEDHNTVLNQNLGYLFPCTGTGDSCQGTSKTLTSASVTSNVADVVISSGHGLSLGSPVLVIGSNVTNTTPCGIDTYYPYPTVSNVVSGTEFKYTVQQTVPNATCQAGYGVLFPSPVAQPFSSPGAKTFTLSSETIDPHLNDGTTLPAPYNVDPLGLTRGADGTWERGAFEFVNGGGAPAPPTDLQAIPH
ncbi:MAG: hypothetical protein ABR881_30500 [Candidatus Sulfotelmatobacter sp.]|jgi:hypothetical protein